MMDETPMTDKTSKECEGRLAEVLRRMYYLGLYADLAYEDDPELVSREIDRRRYCREQGVQCS